MMIFFLLQRRQKSIWAVNMYNRSHGYVLREAKFLGPRTYVRTHGVSAATADATTNPEMAVLLLAAVANLAFSPPLLPKKNVG